MNWLRTRTFRTNSPIYHRRSCKRRCELEGLVAAPTTCRLILEENYGPSRRSDRGPRPSPTTMTRRPSPTRPRRRSPTTPPPTRLGRPRARRCLTNQPTTRRRPSDAWSGGGRRWDETAVCGRYSSRTCGGAGRSLVFVVSRTSACAASFLTTAFRKPSTRETCGLARRQAAKSARRGPTPRRGLRSRGPSRPRQRRRCARNRGSARKGASMPPTQRAPSRRRDQRHDGKRSPSRRQGTAPFVTIDSRWTRRSSSAPTRCALRARTRTQSPKWSGR
mmetsp:Transcript_6221/g.18500  ORF Transcript_6221/g.18500 Transcript_6221/m.18500 type:complete len:276 (+) Transcript_6221:947-1774(+)